MRVHAGTQGTRQSLAEIGPVMPPLGSLVDIGGRRLHYVSLGAGTPMVVFESGGAGASSIQDLPVLRRVAAFTRGCAYDRAGLGWSDSASTGRSYEERVSDLHALLTCTETPPYVLVGSSFGGLLARMYCKLYPDEVAGMVLIDGGDEAKYFSTMQRMRAFHEREIWEDIERIDGGQLKKRLERDLGRTSFFTDQEKAAILEVVPRRSHYTTGLDEFTAIDRISTEQQIAYGFGRLGDRPLVVLAHGTPDPLAEWEEGYAESQEYLASLSSNSALIYAKGVGHSISLEHPALSTAAIRAVVDAVRSGSLDMTAVEELAAKPRVQAS